MSREICVPEKKKLADAAVAQGIKKLRAHLGLNQTEFARRLSAKPSAVSKWESGLNRPSPDVFVRMAKLSDGAEKLFFLENAGVPESFFEGRPMLMEMRQAATEVVAKALPDAQARQLPDSVIQIPLFRDSVAAGTPRAIEARNTEGYIPMLRWWVPRNVQLCALRVTGDSMSPILEEGYIVVINQDESDPKRLVGRMIAARVEEGLTIKWLRKDRDVYMLVPHHVSLRHPITVVAPGRSIEIIGTIVKWIGHPPPVRK